MSIPGGTDDHQGRRNTGNASAYWLTREPPATTWPAGGRKGQRPAGPAPGTKHAGHSGIPLIKQQRTCRTPEAKRDGMGPPLRKQLARGRNGIPGNSAEQSPSLFTSPHDRGRTRDSLESQELESSTFLESILRTRPHERLMELLKYRKGQDAIRTTSYAKGNNVLQSKLRHVRPPGCPHARSQCFGDLNACLNLSVDRDDAPRPTDGWAAWAAVRTPPPTPLSSHSFKWHPSCRCSWLPSVASPSSQTLSRSFFAQKLAPRTTKTRLVTKASPSSTSQRLFISPKASKRVPPTAPRLPTRRPPPDGALHRNGGSPSTSAITTAITTTATSAATMRAECKRGAASRPQEQPARRLLARSNCNSNRDSPPEGLPRASFRGILPEDFPEKTRSGALGYLPRDNFHNVPGGEERPGLCCTDAEWTTRVVENTRAPSGRLTHSLAVPEADDLTQGRGLRLSWSRSAFPYKPGTCSSWGNLFPAKQVRDGALTPFPEDVGHGGA
ncbi:uncharacterized protein LOC134787888 [Penaeus indicus]|uniref:uncharacterized protein LOC134787888 n=1 Tax=Penaeus indicus TaxID=29960 RepID=UPI00300CB243